MRSGQRRAAHLLARRPDAVSGPPRRALIRRSDAGSAVQAVVVIAILTIFVTRAYLHATGYPQIGGKTLHIAHALWGGAAMIVAIVLLLSFAGQRARWTAVLVSGIGFGLFLDEIGKFVTKTNDYFFAPSIAIMYVVVVLLLLLNRWIQDMRRSSPHDDLVEGLLRTAEALGTGVPDDERRRIAALLARAGDGSETDARSAAVAAEILAAVPARRPSRLVRLATRVVPPHRERAVGAGAAMVVGLMLTVFSVAGVISASLTIAQSIEDGTGTAIAAGGRFAGSVLAFVLCLLAWFLHMRHRGGLWSLRLFRGAALVTMLLTEVFDFASEQFGALINVGVGLVALGVLGYRIRFLTRPSADGTVPDPVPAQKDA